MDPFIWCYVPFSPRAIPHLAKRIYGTKAPIEIEIRLTCFSFLLSFLMMRSGRIWRHSRIYLLVA